MELSYHQTKEETGRTLHQSLEVKDEQESEIDEKRQRLTQMLMSAEGVTLPFSITKNGQTETSQFNFRLEGNFKNKNQNLRGGYLIISLPTGEEIGGISYTLKQEGKTSSEPTAFITDKGYIVENGKETYGGLGLMKIAFTLMAEALKEHDIKKVESHITGGNPAEKSRTRAPILFSENQTYEKSSQELIDENNQKILVTNL